MRLEEKERPDVMSANSGERPVLAIRVDGNGEIGSGHVMRCCAVARAARAAGCGVRFFVSDERSAAMLVMQGFEACVLGGDYRNFETRDARLLADAVCESGAAGVIVDSYGATNAFLAELREGCRAIGVHVGYIDDEYRFETGYVGCPVPLPVDVLVNYGFAADASAYACAYRGTGVELLIGPSFAPLREGFCDVGYRVADEVSSVLVTTGSTNPRRTLERIVVSCLAALPDAAIHVVVGPNASYEGDAGDSVVIHHGPSDMRSLMVGADLVVSAAGTTLYELAALGVPTIAVPITENQTANVRGWTRLDLGPSLSYIDWSSDELSTLVRKYTSSRSARELGSLKLSRACDGDGALRVVRSLIK